MKTLHTLIGLSLCALSALALAEDAPRPAERTKPQSTAAKTTWTEADSARVLMKLHETNLMEIEAGNLARDNAASDDVKDYSEALVTDHENADEKVKSLAKDRHILLADKMAADSDAATAMARLRNVRGAEFDRQFLDMMVNDHEKAIGMVKAWRADAQDKELRTLLDELLPSLEKHRDKARKLTRKS